jgi:hypothetical protein
MSPGPGGADEPADLVSVSFASWHQLDGWLRQWMACGVLREHRAAA